MRNGEIVPSKLPSAQYSTIFAKMLDGLGLSDPTISLHSFRHTWITNARNLGISKDRRVVITGHGGKGDVHDEVYTHDDLAFMKETLDMVSFQGFPYDRFKAAPEAV